MAKKFFIICPWRLTVGAVGEVPRESVCVVAAGVVHVCHVQHPALVSGCEAFQKNNNESMINVFKQKRQ